MQLACPTCGTHEIKVSHRQGVLELIKGLFGVYPLQCRRCKDRWLTSVWEEGAWKYARCPRCYRQELSAWSEQYFTPPRGTLIKLRLGAAPYRCTACRCNFTSFKPCKERFAWGQEKYSEAPATQVNALGEAIEMFEYTEPDREFAPVGAIGPLDVLPAPSPSQSRGVPVVSLKHRDDPYEPFAEMPVYVSSKDMEDELEPFL